MSSTATSTRESQLFVGGEWSPPRAAARSTFAIRSPARPSCGRGRHTRRRSPGDRGRGAAFPAWAATPPAVRQGIFLQAADILESRRDEVVDLLARETGCTFGFGMFQMHLHPRPPAAGGGPAYAPVGEVIPSDIPGAMAMGLRQPVGVVGAIAPWNAALILSLRSITAPLVLGNTVVLKPSEWSPVSGGPLWGEIFAEAGLPGRRAQHRHARAGRGRRRSATSSSRTQPCGGSTSPARRTTGRRLAEACGRQLKRVVLELGGSNPLIVLADADLDYAVDAAAFGSFLHQGQICMSTRRIIVERSIADAFTEKLVAKTAALKVGDPKEHDTIIGPLINAQARRDRRARVCRMRSTAGAKVLAGGEAEGPCYQPTLVTDVPADSPFASEETFGPVASIEVVDDADAAVARANATGYGLSAGIITATPSAGFELAGGSSPASSTSTTRRSATSRRCRSAASRTRAGAASAAAPRSRSSPSCAGSRVQSGTRHFPF